MIDTVKEVYEKAILDLNAGHIHNTDKQMQYISVRLDQEGIPHEVRQCIMLDCVVGEVVMYNNMAYMCVSYDYDSGTGNFIEFDPYCKPHNPYFNGAHPESQRLS